MYRISSVFIGISCLLISACTTTLTSKKLNSSNLKNATGQTYMLPKQRLRFAVEYKLKDCKVTEADRQNASKNGIDLFTRSVADVDVDATMTVDSIPDAEASFFVPVSSLSSGNKTTDITVTTSDMGILQNMNATIDDRSAETIGAIVQTAGNIARLVTSGVSTGACSKEYFDFVETRKELIKKLRTDQSLVGPARAAAVDSLSRLQTALRVQRTLTVVPGKTESKSSSQDPEKMLNLFTTNFNFSKAQNRAGYNDAREEMVKWFQNDPDNNLDRLLNTEIEFQLGIGGDNCSNIDSTVPSDFGLDCIGAERDIILIKDDLNDYNNGVIYRDPLWLKVRACLTKCSTNNTNIIPPTDIQLAQFGAWRKIGLKSKPFQDKNFMATWNANGRLTSLMYGSSASNEALFGALNTSTNSIRETIGTFQTTPLEDLTEELNEIRARADIIEQTNRLEALQMTEEVAE